MFMCGAGSLWLAAGFDAVETAVIRALHFPERRPDAMACSFCVRRGTAHRRNLLPCPRDSGGDDEGDGGVGEGAVHASQSVVIVRIEQSAIRMPTQYRSSRISARSIRATLTLNACRGCKSARCRNRRPVASSRWSCRSRAWASSDRRRSFCRRHIWSCSARRRC